MLTYHRFHRCGSVKFHKRLVEKLKMKLLVQTKSTSLFLGAGIRSVAMQNFLVV